MSKETIHLNISGMSCVNCSNGIEKFLKKQDGVENCDVSLHQVKETLKLILKSFQKRN